MFTDEHTLKDKARLLNKLLLRVLDKTNLVKYKTVKVTDQPYLTKKLERMKRKGLENLTRIEKP